MTRFLAIATLRNEGSFLLEWLAHHRAAGFTDFLIFSNDCDDGTDAMLDRLHAMGEIAHVPNPGPHQRGPQWEALARVPDHPLWQECDWAMVLDIDEFVNVHVGDHTLQALISALPEADAITLTWRLFGNAGIVDYRDLPVTGQFTRCAPKVIGYPWRAVMFKTLFRLGPAWERPGVHRPRAADPGTAHSPRWFGGDGGELEGAFLDRRLFSRPDRDNYALVQLNHYPLGAMQSYLVKMDRGRANRNDGPLGMDYWVERNWCSHHDDSISALDGARDPIRARLAADPALDALHAGAVEWRRNRIAELMLEDTYRALFGRLLMTPPARQIPPHLAAHIFAYAGKARERRA